MEMQKDSPLAGKTALITGASSGIGSGIAKALAERGCKLWLTGRNEERLAAIAGDTRGSRLYPCDLSDRDSMDHLFSELQSEPLEIVVNCAGVAARAGITDGAWEDWKEMMDVNVMALTYCSQKSVILFPAGGGHIVNVSSLSGHRVPPGGGFYAATKFAVNAVCQALRWELRAAGNKTKVTSLSPGFVETPLLDRYFKGREDDLGALGKSITMLKPEDVAAAVVHALEAPPHVEYNDFLMRPTDQAT